MTLQNGHRTVPNRGDGSRTNGNGEGASDAPSRRFRSGCNEVEGGVFAERIPVYLREGYDALMRRDARRAIELWQALYERYPSAEVCGHLARAHYYQIFFQGHEGDHPRHVEHVRQMKSWAERALLLNNNSSIGHAMMAGALAREAQLTGSRREVILSAVKVRYHAERAVLIDNNWIGHYILGMWHRELAAVNAGTRAIIKLLNGRKLPRGSYPKSVEHFEEVLKQFPECNVMHAEIAITYHQMGKLDEAEKAYRLCLASPMFRHPVAPCFIDSFRERFDAIFGAE